MRVTTSFVRNIRKAHLQEDGSPAPGHKHAAKVLLSVHKAIQFGLYDEAIEYARTEGYDLEAMYESYRKELAQVKAFGSSSLGLRSTWFLIERIMRKYGLKPQGIGATA